MKNAGCNLLCADYSLLECYRKGHNFNYLKDTMLFKRHNLIELLTLIRAIG